MPSLRHPLFAVAVLCLLLRLLDVAVAGDDTKRIAVPGKSELAKSEMLVKDIFGESIAAAKDAEARLKIASELLIQGDQCKDAADRYVCYRTASVLAGQAGDAALAFAAVDKLARHFEVNALDLKTAALATVAANVQSKDTARSLVDVILPLISDAVDADNYELALRLGGIADDAAKKSQSIALVRAVGERIQEVQAVQKGFSRLQPFVDRLKKNPKDGEANLELGKYYAHLKGKWDKALPLLAMGSDEALKTQARKDLTRPKAAKDQILIADGWWDLSQNEKDPAKLNLQRRAAHWYEQAVGDLRGLSRLKASKRLDQLAGRLVASNDTQPLGPVGELRKLEGHTDEIRSVAFSPDGRYVVSGGLDQTVRVWDLQGQGKDPIAVLKGHTKQVWSVTFHPNLRQVVSGSWDGTARLWDIKSGNEVKRLTHEKDVNGVVLSRDGQQLLTGCDTGSAYLWKISGEEIRRYPGFSNYVYCVALSSRYVAAGSNDKTARVFDLATGQVVKTFERHTDAVMSVALSSDNRYLYVCGDGAAHQYDIASGKEVRRYEGKSGRVLGLSISSDGRRLLTAGDDRFVHLWDTNSGKLLQSFAGHTDTVNSVSFSPDNHRAVSAGLDRTIRVWGLPR